MSQDDHLWYRSYASSSNMPLQNNQLEHLGASKVFHGTPGYPLKSRILKQKNAARFGAAVSSEIAQEDAQTTAEVEYCKRETERLNLAARLASLAATAEHRTRGGVVLRRLPPTHPQHARCLRAATENVKPGFFSSDSPYGGVRVLEIYKVGVRVKRNGGSHAASRSLTSHNFSYSRRKNGYMYWCSRCPRFRVFFPCGFPKFHLL